MLLTDDFFDRKEPVGPDGKTMFQSPLDIQTWERARICKQSAKCLIWILVPMTEVYLSDNALIYVENPTTEWVVDGN